MFYTEYNLNTSGALSFYLSEFLNFCSQSLSLYTWDDCLNCNRSLNDASSKSWSHPHCITSRLYKNTNILMTLESAYFRPLSLFPRFNSQISNAYWILSVGYPIGILNLFCPKHKSSFFFSLEPNMFLILFNNTVTHPLPKAISWESFHIFFFSLLLKHKSPVSNSNSTEFVLWAYYL